LTKVHYTTCCSRFFPNLRDAFLEKINIDHQLLNGGSQYSQEEQIQKLSGGNYDYLIVKGHRDEKPHRHLKKLRDSRFFDVYGQYFSQKLHKPHSHIRPKQFFNQVQFLN
jgi:hypothetical protein